MRYVFVTHDGGEGFETHGEAFNIYENHNEEFRGVYLIRSEGVEPINVSGNMFNHEESFKLKQTAKKVANRHRRENDT